MAHRSRLSDLRALSALAVSEACMTKMDRSGGPDNRVHRATGDVRTPDRSYVVVWDGRGSIPGMSGKGWEQQHGNITMQYASPPEPARRGLFKAGRLRCDRCGERMAAKGRRVCSICHLAKYQKPVAVAGTCPDCGAAVKAAEVRLGVRRCRDCRDRAA